MIGGLLEGAAFLAARVQLKLKHEFSDFTTNLDRPVGAALSGADAVVRARPGEPEIRRSEPARGADHRREARNFDATYREAQRNVACRFTLASAITLWPFEIVKAEYLTSAAALQALVPGAGAECVACLRLQLTVRAAARPEDEPADKEAFARPGPSLLVVPREGAPLPSARPGNRRGRPLRATLRPLSRRLFSDARLVRRSDRRARRARHDQANRLRGKRGPDPERQPAVPRLRFPARLFRLSQALSRLRHDRPRRGRATARGEDRRHRGGFRRREGATRCGDPQGVFRPLRGAGRQSVREDAGPHSGQVQSVRVPCHPRSEPAARFRDEPGDPGVRAHSRRAAEGSGRAALLGDGVAQRDRAVVHDSPPAAPAHDRGKEIRTGFKLCRHGRLSVARRTFRSRRTSSRRGTQRRSPVHQPASRRASSRRRERRRFSLPRQCRIGRALHCGSDGGARASHDCARGQGDRRFDREKSPGASSTC